MTGSRRTLKAAEAIREVVAMSILTDIKDPRVRDATITHVEVSGDMRYAKVYVSVMGDENKEKLTLRGLQSAAGYLQTKCAKRIDTRYTPRLQFQLDEGVKKSVEVTRLLSEIFSEESAAQTSNVALADDIADDKTDQETDDSSPELSEDVSPE